MESSNIIKALEIITEYLNEHCNNENENWKDIMNIREIISEIGNEKRSV